MYQHETEVFERALSEDSREEALYPRARQMAACEELRRIFDGDESQ